MTRQQATSQSGWEAAKTERPKAKRNKATTGHSATCTKLKVHRTARSPAGPRAKVSGRCSTWGLQCTHEPWMCPSIQIHAHGASPEKRNATKCNIPSFGYK